MEKSKDYDLIKFSPQRIKEVYELWLNSSPQDTEVRYSYRNISFKNEHWSHDNDAEFFADYVKDIYSFNYSFEKDIHNTFTINGIIKSCTTLKITAPSRAQIEGIFNALEKDIEQFKLPKKPKEEKSIKPPVLFIGHGRDEQWRDLKDHLADKHGFKIVAYETGARAGHTIRDVLDDMLDQTSFAILVMSGEDQHTDNSIYPRANVIHETGLFQGKLGFSRAIVLLEDGTTEFSNLHGIQQIRYKKGNIKETFGEVLATIKREFDYPKTNV